MASFYRLMCQSPDRRKVYFVTIRKACIYNISQLVRIICDNLYMHVGSWLWFFESSIFNYFPISTQDLYLKFHNLTVYIFPSELFWNTNTDSVYALNKQTENISSKFEMLFLRQVTIFSRFKSKKSRQIISKWCIQISSHYAKYFFYDRCPQSVFIMKIDRLMKYIDPNTPSFFSRKIHNIFDRKNRYINHNIFYSILFKLTFASSSISFWT